MTHRSVTVSPGDISLLGDIIGRGGYAEYYGVIAGYGSDYGDIGYIYVTSWSASTITSDVVAQGRSFVREVLGLNDTTFSEVRSHVQKDLAVAHFEHVRATSRLPTTQEIFEMHEVVFAKHSIPGSWIGSSIWGPVVDWGMGVEPGDPHCFAAGTSLAMSDGTTKPIEQVRAGDKVLSYDVSGNLVPSRVTRTFENRVQHILDFHGLKVTPGHVTLCAVVEGEEDTPAGRLARPRNANDSLVGRHVPLIDILVADGAVMKQDGTPVQAATDEVVDSRADAFVRCHAYLTGEDLKAGRYVEGRMRAGTKLITEDSTVSVLETVEVNGYAFDAETGLVTKDGVTGPMPFFGALPKPEDHVLRRSGLTLEAIQAANEWEGGQRPAIAPAAMAGTAPASSNLNRKQRRAMKAKSKGRPARMH